MKDSQVSGIQKAMWSVVSAHTTLRHVNPARTGAFALT